MALFGFGSKDKDKDKDKTTTTSGKTTTTSGKTTTTSGKTATTSGKTTTTTSGKTTTTTATNAAKTTATVVKPATTTVNAQTAAAAAAMTAATAAAASTTTATKTPFTDVPANAYYAAAVNWAVKQGITTGRTETTFDPDKPCTRGHVATFLWRMKGSPAPKAANNPFTDVSEGAFYKAILWANENNIINGVTATTFEPNTPCTRAQALTALLHEQGVASATEADAATWAKEKGLLTGLSGDATTACTRADIVTFLYRVQSK